MKFGHADAMCQAVNGQSALAFAIAGCAVVRDISRAHSDPAAPCESLPVSFRYLNTLTVASVCRMTKSACVVWCRAGRARASGRDLTSRREWGLRNCPFRRGEGHIPQSNPTHFLAEISTPRNVMDGIAVSLGKFRQCSRPRCATGRRAAGSCSQPLMRGPSASWKSSGSPGPNGADR